MPQWRTRINLNLVEKIRHGREILRLCRCWLSILAVTERRCCLLPVYKNEIIMPSYRLIVDLGPNGPARSLSVNLKDRAEAFLVAQRYDRPATLWHGDAKLCSINRVGEGGMWIISP